MSEGWGLETHSNPGGRILDHRLRKTKRRFRVFQSGLNSRRVGQEDVKRHGLWVQHYAEVTSQFSGMILATKGPLTSAGGPEPNYECYPQSELDGGEKSERGQHFAVSPRQSVRSPSRSSREHSNTLRDVRLTERS